MTMDDKLDVSDFVRHVQESTQAYAKELLKENERLAGLVGALHEEKVRLERLIASLEERVKSQAVAETSLQGQLADLKATSDAFSQRYLEVEQLNSNLANLYVASYRIHGSLDREDVLTTLREILINLIGTEEFAVYERDGSGALLQCATSFGLDPARIQAVRIGEGRLGAVISNGETFIASHDPEVTSTGQPVTACVPLRVGDQVVGAIVVYRLLSHKPALEAADMELFNLLATHGATALYCCSLHARCSAQQACA
jgi:hypothetical protein